MKPTPEQIKAAANAIANARGARRGAPRVVNILDILPQNLRDEVMEDAEAALTAANELKCPSHSIASLTLRYPSRSSA